MHGQLDLGSDEAIDNPLVCVCVCEQAHANTSKFELPSFILRV
jgi:hypothetical protein